MEYWARVTSEGKQYLVDFPDAPGCQTFASRKRDVHAQALGALEGWLEAHLVTGAVPPARRARRKHSGSGWLRVVVPPMLAIRIGVRQARHEMGITQAELAKRIGVSKQQISLLESPDANIRVDTLDRLASALDLDVEINLRPRRDSGEFAVAAAG